MVSMIHGKKKKSHHKKKAKFDITLGGEDPSMMWNVLNSSQDPRKALCLFKLYLESINKVAIYYKDDKILLNMIQLQVALFGGDKDTAKRQIWNLKNGPKNQNCKTDFRGLSKWTLTTYQIPGQSGHPKPVIELRHSIEYTIAQQGLIPTMLRKTLIEIAFRAMAGDHDLFTQVEEWQKTMDPIMRSILMSGYVPSAEAMQQDLLSIP